MSLFSSSAARIRVLYDSYANSEYIGEAISIVEHSIQAAYFAARDDENDRELIVASLLHDVGHVLGIEAAMDLEMDGCGINDHEIIGADFLRKLNLPERVCKLVQSHVLAKRYLCAKEPEYFSQLSDASKTTLSFQGGPMTSQEVTTFELDPDYQHIINMRKYDECAKVVDFMHQIPPFGHYLALVDLLLQNDRENHLKPCGSFINSDYLLSNQQLNTFKTKGSLKINNLFSFENVLHVGRSENSDNHLTSNVNPSYKTTCVEFTACTEKHHVVCRLTNYAAVDGKTSHSQPLESGNIWYLALQLLGRRVFMVKELPNDSAPDDFLVEYLCG